jgi:hypothetical protein
MCVTVQQNINIIWGVIRWNVLQAESQSISRNIQNQRPLEIAVTISAHHDYRRSDRAQFVENCFCADVTQMPDLISTLCHLPHTLRQAIMGVRKNKDARGSFGFCVRNHVAF